MDVSCVLPLLNPKTRLRAPFASRARCMRPSPASGCPVLQDHGRTPSLSERSARCPLGVGRADPHRLTGRTPRPRTGHRPACGPRPAQSPGRDPLREPHRHPLALPPARPPALEHRLHLLRPLAAGGCLRPAQQSPAPPSTQAGRPRGRAQRVRHRLTKHQDIHQRSRSRPRRRCGQEDRGPQAEHRHRHRRPASDSAGHGRERAGLRRRPSPHREGGRRASHRPQDLGRRRLPPAPRRARSNPRHRHAHRPPRPQHQRIHHPAEEVDRRENAGLADEPPPPGPVAPLLPRFLVQDNPIGYLSGNIVAPQWPLSHHSESWAATAHDEVSSPTVQHVTCARAKTGGGRSTRTSTQVPGASWKRRSARCPKASGLPCPGGRRRQGCPAVEHGRHRHH